MKYQVTTHKQKKLKIVKIKTTHELDLTRDGKQVIGFPWDHQGAILAED